MQVDYIVVGGGAAGSVVARRLLDAGATVQLLEAGAEHLHPLMRIPAGFGMVLQAGTGNWGYQTQPMPGLNGRTIAYHRGKLLGGSGSINGLMQSWGLPHDYDRWAAEGCVGWSYDEVRPYFMKSENYPAGDSTTRGHGGPIKISDFDPVHPVSADFLHAGNELGLPTLRDYNTESREGVAMVQQTRDGRQRVTAATAYLKPVRRHPRLTLSTHAFVNELLLDEQRRVRGVAFVQGGSRHEVFAAKEVILCGGAVNTPHLLNLSGIGDGADLQAAGLPVKHHLPGVGRGLQDHFICKVVQRVRGTTTLNEQGRGLRLLKEMADYLVRGRGILTYSFATCTGYAKVHVDDELPDLQISFAPGSFPPSGGYALDPLPGMTLGMWHMRPKSRGTVRTVSPNPDEAPHIIPGFLTHEYDQRAAVAAMRWSRRFMQAGPLARHAAEEVLPGAGHDSDEALLEYARNTGGTAYHASCTCRMGNETDAVVSPTLQVHGIGRLSIADASVMRHVTSGNTHAPVVMIAEKAADMILRRHATD